MNVVSDSVVAGSDGFYEDIRVLLRDLDVHWRDVASIHALRRQAEENLYCSRRFLEMLSPTVDADLFPEEAKELAIDQLFLAAVKSASFPDQVSVTHLEWEDQARIWDEFMAHQRPFVLAGVQRFSAENRWSIREAIQAAWNIEFAAIGRPNVLGQLACDSAHRLAMRLPVTLWMEFAAYCDRVEDGLVDRTRGWDIFQATWSIPNLSISLSTVRSQLVLESRELIKMFEADSESPATLSPQDDGPVSPDGFRWKGQTVDGLTSTEFELVSFVHARRDDPPSIDEVKERFWPNSYADRGSFDKFAAALRKKLQPIGLELKAVRKQAVLRPTKR